MTEHPTAATQPDNEDGAALAPGELVVPDDDGALELFPPAQAPVMAAQVMLHQHAAMMVDAYQLADGICYTNLVPDRYRGKPKDGAAAILYGAELGLNPIASLQRVINVHGTPGLEARTMKALLKSKGFKFRTVTKTVDEYEIHAWEPDSDRRTDPPDEIGHWTMDRARQAEYCPVIDPDTGEYRTFTRKNGEKAVVGNMKYITDPIGMLEAKGTADVCRAVAPEILIGLPYATEELSTERWNDPDDDDDRPERAPTRARGTDALRERAHKAKAAREEPVDAEEVALSADTVADLVTETAIPVIDTAKIDAGTFQPDAAPGLASEPDTPKAPTTGKPDIAPEPVPDATPPSDNPVKPSTPDVTPEPAPVAPTTIAAPDDANPPPYSDAADLPMSPAVRSKGVDMCVALLIAGGLDTDEYRGDVLSEIIGKRPGGDYRRVESVGDLTNTELKFVVDTLRAWRAQNQLESWVGEAVNNAALRDAGLLPEDGPDSAEDVG